MIRQEEALARILTALQPLPPREVPLLEALDGFAVEERRATVALPPFDNSAMDGYAVVSSSCREGARLRLSSG